MRGDSTSSAIARSILSVLMSVYSCCASGKRRFLQGHRRSVRRRSKQLLRDCLTPVREQRPAFIPYLRASLSPPACGRRQVELVAFAGF
jgi:hypothetical protein